ncbi:hypothetical protein [Sulfitobacter sp.]|uniref:hypothetical protein n=1 Tax=Sulfitobacter sp. TaxID=1903071 RepID=UPI003002C842
MKIFPTLAVISFMTIAGTANAGVDCSSLVPGAKNLGDVQQFLKDNGFNNLNQFIREVAPGVKTGEYTQAILAACGVGSEAP